MMRENEQNKTNSLVLYFNILAPTVENLSQKTNYSANHQQKTIPKRTRMLTYHTSIGGQPLATC